jgi:hypothetical protein
MNLLVAYKTGNFLNSWVTISFSRKTLVHRGASLLIRIWVSSVSMVTRLRAGRPGFDSRQRQGSFSLRHRVQIGLGIHPVAYRMCTGGKATRTWSWPLPFSDECVELYLHSPNRSSWCGTCLNRGTSLLFTSSKSQSTVLLFCTDNCIFFHHSLITWEWSNELVSTWKHCQRDPELRSASLMRHIVKVGLKCVW